MPSLGADKLNGVLHLGPFFYHQRGSDSPYVFLNRLGSRGAKNICWVEFSGHKKDGFFGSWFLKILKSFMMSCKSIGGFPTGFFQMEAQKELQLRGLKNLLTKNHEF